MTQDYRKRAEEIVRGFGIQGEIRIAGDVSSLEQVFQQVASEARQWTLDNGFFLGYPVDDIKKLLDSAYMYCGSPKVEDFIAFLKDMRSNIRHAAIEECAKIADEYEISQVAFSMKDPSLEIKSKLSGKAISKAIRALGEKE